MINFDEFETMDNGEVVLHGGRYISFYPDGDGYVTLDGGFTVEELRQLVAHLKRTTDDWKTCGIRCACGAGKLSLSKLRTCIPALEANAIRYQLV